MGYTAAEDRVDSDSFRSITAVLGGDSPWKSFITAALADTLKNIPKDVFRVLPPDEYKIELARIDPKAEEASTPGITDKKTGIIRMKGYFGLNSREAMLGLSLHETVHLVSHKPGKSGARSTAYGFLEEGLLEGLVEKVTTDILTTQRITLADPRKRAHQKRVPVVEELMNSYGINTTLLGSVLFKGDFEVFFRLMEAAFGGPGWQEIKRLTTAEHPEKAKTRMSELRAAEERAHPGVFKTKLQQSGPKAITPATIQPAKPAERPYVQHRGMSPPPPVRY